MTTHVIGERKRAWQNVIIYIWYLILDFEITKGDFRRKWGVWHWLLIWYHTIAQSQTIFVKEKNVVFWRNFVQHCWLGLLLVCSFCVEHKKFWNAIFLYGLFLHWSWRVGQIELVKKFFTFFSNVKLLGWEKSLESANSKTTFFYFCWMNMEL